MREDNKILKGWKETTLGEILTLQRGFDLPKADRTVGVYPLMVSNGQDGTHDEFKVKGPGVITGRSGSLGSVFLIKKNFWPLNTTLWVKDFKGNNVSFIYYFLKTFPFERYNSGSGVPTLNRNHIHPLPVVIPKDVKEQKSIASILTSFDDKIELLQAQNETLETTAQNIFKEWFGKYQVGDELPEGWRVGKYQEIVDLSSGKGVKKSEYIDDGKYEIIGANGSIGNLDKFLINEKIIVTGRVGTLGTVFIINKPAWISDNVLISKPKNNCLFHFAYFTLKGFNFTALNTGSTQPLITQGDLKSVGVVIPNETVLQSFEKVSSKLFQKIEYNQEQIQTLLQTRDTLLPKLMSGKLRVEEFREPLPLVCNKGGNG